MAVLKCTICGGELELNADFSVGVCQYCGSTITIPRELDHKGNYYNRAVFLRQSNEFDRAVDIYEDILKEDNSDAEAHWGLVLSKYGIEYVADPNSGEYLPTCHRTQNEPILSDPDYLAALQYSDEQAKSVIQTEAKRISVIQARILEISEKEPPYDIFICYKETAEDGTRSRDSMLAQELYYELLKHDYKVFFARKTLERKLGDEYEPIIYAALNSAKVMIVLGTKPENFNAVWVRNEWSRFMKMAREQEKVIIPAYRDFSPYELPVELSNLQSQDMSKIGFMQDLVDGIERCLRRNKKPQAPQPAVAYVGESESCEKLIKNGNVFLRLDNFTAAREVFEKLTKNYPDEYMGWWGLVLCETQDLTVIPNDPATVTTWFKYAQKLADEKNGSDIQQRYVEFCRKIAEDATAKEFTFVKEYEGKHKDYIQSLNNSIDMVKASIEARDQSYVYQSGVDSDSIKAHRRTLELNQKNLLKKQITLLVGFVSIFIAILGFIVYGNTQEDAAIIFSIVFLVSTLISFGISPKGKMKNFKNAIKYSEDNLDNAAKYMQNNKIVYENDIKAFKQSINELESNINLSYAKISACEKYLSLGKDKIYDLCYANECAKFGVKQPFDPYVKDCRDYAYGFKDVEVNEVTVVCKNCKHSVVGAEHEIYSADAVCPVCHQKLIVDDSDSVAGVNNASSQQYNVSCDACGQSFVVDKKDVDNGYCYCKSCGRKILFKD